MTSLELLKICLVEKINLINFKGAKEAKIFSDGSYGTLSKDAKELMDNFVFNADGTLNYGATITKLQNVNMSDSVLKEAGLTATMNYVDITSKKYNALWQLAKDGEISYEDAQAILTAGDDTMIEKMASVLSIGKKLDGVVLKDENGKEYKYPAVIDKWATGKTEEYFQDAELATTLKNIFNVKNVRFFAKDGVYGLDSLAEQVKSRWQNIPSTPYRSEGDRSLEVEGLNKAKTQITDIIANLTRMARGKSAAVAQKINQMKALYQETLDTLNEVVLPPIQGASSSSGPSSTYGTGGALDNLSKIFNPSNW